MKTSSRDPTPHAQAEDARRRDFRARRRSCGGRSARRGPFHPRRPPEDEPTPRPRDVHDQRRGRRSGALPVRERRSTSQARAGGSPAALGTPRSSSNPRARPLVRDAPRHVQGGGVRHELHPHARDAVGHAEGAREEGARRDDAPETLLRRLASEDATRENPRPGEGRASAPTSWCPRRRGREKTKDRRRSEGEAFAASETSIAGASVPTLDSRRKTLHEAFAPRQSPTLDSRRKTLHEAFAPRQSRNHAQTPR